MSDDNLANELRELRERVAVPEALRQWARETLSEPLCGIMQQEAARFLLYCLPDTVTRPVGSREWAEQMMREGHRVCTPLSYGYSLRNGEFLSDEGHKWCDQKYAIGWRAYTPDPEPQYNFAPLADEITDAIDKHGTNQRHMLAALMEEVGEVAQAYLEGDHKHARHEALQVACVAWRIYTGGDDAFEKPNKEAE